MSHAYILYERHMTPVKNGFPNIKRSYIANSSQLNYFYDFTDDRRKAYMFTGDEKETALFLADVWNMEMELVKCDG